MRMDYNKPAAEELERILEREREWFKTVDPDDQLDPKDISHLLTDSAEPVYNFTAINQKMQAHPEDFPDPTTFSFEQFVDHLMNRDLSRGQYKHWDAFEALLWRTNEQIADYARTAIIGRLRGLPDEVDRRQSKIVIGAYGTADPEIRGLIESRWDPQHLQDIVDNVPWKTKKGYRVERPPASHGQLPEPGLRKPPSFEEGYTEPGSQRKDTPNIPGEYLQGEYYASIEDISNVTGLHEQAVISTSRWDGIKTEMAPYGTFPRSIDAVSFAARLWQEENYTAARKLIKYVQRFTGHSPQNVATILQKSDVRPVASSALPPHKK